VKILGDSRVLVSAVVIGTLALVTGTGVLAQQPHEHGHHDPAADANLHYVIADLLRGAGLMRGQDPERSPNDGAALVHGALGAYGRYFDDPSFAR
jgi:hypothetical protein